MILLGGSIWPEWGVSITGISSHYQPAYSQHFRPKSYFSGQRLPRQCYKETGYPRWCGVPSPFCHAYITQAVCTHSPLWNLQPYYQTESCFTVLRTGQNNRSSNQKTTTARNKPGTVWKAYRYKSLYLPGMQERKNGCYTRTASHSIARCVTSKSDACPYVRL